MCDVARAEFEDAQRRRDPIEPQPAQRLAEDGARAHRPVHTHKIAPRTLRTRIVGGQRIDQLGSGALAKWRASNVGFVFQFYNLMPMLSAQRNVELPLLLTKLSGAQRKRNASIALQLVGLADRASHKPSELSGGQQQRVAIARAIVSDPSLLVCDEPTGDLDRQSAEDVLGLLQQLNREHGKTIVMVTHDPKAAEYASHTLHLDKGTLVEQALA